MGPPYQSPEPQGFGAFLFKWVDENLLLTSVVVVGTSDDRLELAHATLADQTGAMKSTRSLLEYPQLVLVDAGSLALAEAREEESAPFRSNDGSRSATLALTRHQGILGDSNSHQRSAPGCTGKLL